MKVKTTYANKIREAMRDQTVTLRDLEKETKFSYEHLRKVRAGRTIISKEVSDAICAMLHLDATEMWEIAKAEKLRNRYGEIPAALIPPADDRIKKYWPHLTHAEKDEITHMVEIMAKKRLILAKSEDESELVAIIQSASSKLGTIRNAAPARERKAAS